MSPPLLSLPSPNALPSAIPGLMDDLVLAFEDIRFEVWSWGQHLLSDPLIAQKFHHKQSELNTPNEEFLSARDSNKETSTTFRQESPTLSGCVLNFLFPLKTPTKLSYYNLFNEWESYELDNNWLLIQIMAFPAHDTAANA